MKGGRHVIGQIQHVVAEADSVGGHRDGVCQGEHEPNGPSQFRAQRP